MNEKKGVSKLCLELEGLPAKNMIWRRAKLSVDVCEGIGWVTAFENWDKV